MILTGTTQSIELLLASAATTNACPFTTSYIDGPITSYTPTAGFGQSNGTAAVTVLTGPASNQKRIQEFTFYNADTVATTVTIRFKDSTATPTTYILQKVTLAVGDSLQYVTGHGFYVNDSTGNRKVQAARTTNDRLRQLSMTVNGGLSALTTGIKGDIECPYSGIIQSVRLFPDQSGSIVFDIWKDTYANYPPTVADTITASAKPTISSSTKYQDTTLSGWNTAITAGDILRFNIDSCATITRCLCSLTVLTN